MPLNVIYEGVDLGVGLKMDLVVDERVLIEVKSVAELAAVHHKQVIAYLKISGLRLGLLVNFNTDNISGSIKKSERPLARKNSTPNKTPYQRPLRNPRENKLADYAEYADSLFQLLIQPDIHFYQQHSALFAKSAGKNTQPPTVI